MIIITDILNEEYAQGLIEYSLLISLIALAVLGSIILFGESVFALYETIKEDVKNVL